MANAGNSSDYKLLNRMIKEDKYLKNEDPYSVVGRIKILFNRVVANDVASHGERYRGKKVYYHSAWQTSKKAAIKANKIRMQNWYWEPIPQIFK